MAATGSAIACDCISCRRRTPPTDKDTNAPARNPERADLRYLPARERRRNLFRERPLRWHDRRGCAGFYFIRAREAAAPDYLFAQFTGGAGRRPSYGVIAERWPQPRQADGSRTCARSRFRAGTVVVFIRWPLAAPSAAPDYLFAQFTGGAGRRPSYGVIAERWPQPRQADGSRTCARSRFRAGTVVVFIRWPLAAPSAAPDYLFAQFTGGAGRRPSYGVIAERWPQPRQADGSRTCARSRFRAGTVVVFIRWPLAAPSAAPDYLFAQFTGGAGRRPSYGVIAERWPQPRQADGSRTCARSRFRAGTVVVFIRWPLAAPSAAPDYLFAQFTGGAGRRPSYGVIAERWPQPRQADGSRTCARSRFRAGTVVVFIRWPLAAPSAAPDYLFAQFTGGAGRRPSYGVIAERWPQPRQADGSRTCARSRFRAGTVVVFIRWPLAAPSAAPDYLFAQFTGGAGRRPSYGVIAERWPQPRQADGSRTCARSRFRAGTVVVFIRWPLAAPSAAPDYLFAQFTGGAGRRPSYGVIAERWPQPRQADGSRTCARSRFRAGTVVVFIRWPLAAPSAAPDYLFAQFTGGAGRRPSYGVIAERWPQPRQADGSRTCARSRFRAGTVVVFIRWPLAAPSAAPD